MPTLLILGMTLCCQIAAIALAFTLGRRSGRQPVWLLLTTALALAAFQSALTLKHRLEMPYSTAAQLVDAQALTALLLSALLVWGLSMVGGMVSANAKREESLRSEKRQLSMLVDRRVADLEAEVTERSRAETALREDADRFTAIISTQRDIATAALDMTAVLNLIAARTQELTHASGAVIELAEGDGFLSLVTDAYSRKIVGYHLSGNLCASGPVAALEMAIEGCGGTKGLIHHSDRGVQYCCNDYTGILQKREIGISMTQSGDPRENAIAERVNGILKTEVLKQDIFADIVSAKAAIKEAVETYNYLRPHSSVAMLPPAVAHLAHGELKRCWKNYYKRKSNTAEIMDG